MGRGHWLCSVLLTWGCGRVGFAPINESGSDDAGDGPDATASLTLTEIGIDLDGLVALWAFDVPSAVDGATFPAFPDASLVATLETGDSNDVIVVGQVGTAVHLDGVNDRLVVPDAPALDISGPHTMTAWIYMDTLPSNDYGLVGKQLAYGVEIESDTDCIDSSAFFPDGTLVELVPAGCGLSAGTWHHVAAVFDGTDLIAYQDGALVGTTPYGDTSVMLNDMPVIIGDNTFAPGRFMDGRLDEVTIWSRALRADEVQAIVQRQRP